MLYGASLRWRPLATNVQSFFWLLRLCRGPRVLGVLCVLRGTLWLARVLCGALWRLAQLLRVYFFFFLF